MYIDIRHISKAFNGQSALNDINFGVQEGKLTALLGPSGCGKTTLLRVLAGLETAGSGQVAIAGRIVDDIKPQERGIGFVFQNYALFRYLNVYDNVAFGLKTKHWPAAKIKARVQELLDLTGLTDLAQRYPDQLSGGQKQRVAFVRAIAPNPKVLFLDEPFAALDSQIRQELRIWLKNLIHQVGITSIFVTHDHEEAIETADEIVVMNQGQIQQVGTPLEIYYQPQNEFVANFIGHSSLLKNPDLNGYDLPSTACQVQIRPEHVHIHKLSKKVTSFGQSATVTAVQFKGLTTNVALDVQGQKLLAYWDAGATPLGIGEQVQITIERLVVFQNNQSQILKAQSTAQRQIQVL